MDQNLQVVILCGGTGTRLREETEFRPKPMVDIGGRPILWHIMKIYAHHGYTNFVLALGYKGEMIKNYFCHYELMNNDVTIELGKKDEICIHQSHEEAGWQITLANTGGNTLKGARLKKIQKYILTDTFMVTYGDGVANIDLHSLLNFHKMHGKIATLTAISPASQFGELRVNGDCIESIREKPEKGGSLVNAGYFVFDRRIFDYLTEDPSCDLEIGVLEKIAGEGQLMVFRHPGFWACMDNLRDMDSLNTLWDANQAAWKVW